MKLNFNKNSLAILSIVAGIVYLFILVSEIGEAFEGGAQGFKKGADSALRELDDNPANDFENDYFLISLDAKDKNNFYPDSILNKATNNSIPVRIEKMEVFYEFRNGQPLWSIFAMIFLMFLALPILVLLILIPIQFYKLIFSLYKNNVFTQENVNRIQKIGIFYIIIYAYILAFSFYQYFLVRSVIDLENYEIVRPNLASESLLIGLVALIFATVLKRAIVMKEEQDLTI